jgi:formylglycine-generating enzyme required for sulfatase activity
MNEETGRNIVWRNKINAWSALLMESAFLVFNRKLILDYRTGLAYQIDMGDSEIEAISNGKFYTRTWLHEKKAQNALNPPSLIQCRKLPVGELLWNLEINDANTIIVEDELLVLHASGMLCRYSQEDGSLLDQLNLEMAKEEWVSYFRVGSNLFLWSPKRTRGAFCGGNKWLICVCLKEFTLEWTVNLPSTANGQLFDKYGYPGELGMISDSCDRILIGAGSKLLGLDPKTGKAGRKAFNLGGTWTIVRKCYSDGTIIVGSQNGYSSPELKCLDNHGNTKWSSSLRIEETVITAWLIVFYKDYIFAPFKPNNIIRIIDRKNGYLIRDVHTGEIGIGKLQEIRVFNDEQVLMCGSSGSTLYDGIPSTWITLSSEEAETLVKKEGTLSLGWVTTLSENVGRVLAKHKGDLCLDGLTNLSDARAEILARHEGSLFLNGLTNLSDAAVESLAVHKGSLFLDGLTNLSDIAAEALAKHKHSLFLCGLTSLSDLAIKALAKYEGSLISLGLTSLSDAAAKALAGLSGDIDLPKITSLNDSSAHVALAAKLATSEAELYLDGLTSIAGVAAEALTQHEGDLYISLDGLTSLSDEVAKALAKNKGGLSLNGLKSLSETVAKAFANNKGSLSLGGLTTLSEATAKALAKRKDGLPSVSDVAAKVLTKYVAFADLNPELWKVAYDKNQALKPALSSVCEAGQLIEVTLPQGVMIQFCSIPAGSFTMGSPQDEEGRSDEWGEDQVEVTLSNHFWMAKTEVTQAQWEAIMGSNPSDIKGANYPVESVSWEDAQAFITKVNDKQMLPQGWKFALPTEAQWEYACRAGEAGPYSGGSLDEVGWHFENSMEEGNAEVSQKKSNAWGLYDMHGNVWEWCADWYNETLMGGNDPAGPSLGECRVIRGGASGEFENYCRAASRLYCSPGDRDNQRGFRPAIVPS